MKRYAPPDQTVWPTPFHAAAAAQSMTNAWSEQGQFTIATTYTEIEEEYQAVRNGVAVCDHSSICKYRISGHDSSAFLDRLVTRPIDTLDVKQGAFTPFCDDRGHVIDFAQIFRLGFGDYVLHTTLPALAWLKDTSFGFTDLVIEDVTKEIAILGIHGTPSSFALLLAGFAGVEQLKPGEVGPFGVKDIEVHISRTRALGELGYSIWLDPRDALAIWDRMFRAAQKLSLKPVGTLAQEICRLEAGHLVPNVDFIGARSAEHANRPRNPFELGLGSCVDLTKRHFVGMTALAKKEVRTHVVGLYIDGDYAMTQGRVMSGNRLVGSISSSGWSPRLGRIIALATVAASYSGQGTQLSAEAWKSIELEPTTMRQDALVADRKFYMSPARDAAMRPKSSG